MVEDGRDTEFVAESGKGCVGEKTERLRAT